MRNVFTTSSHMRSSHMRKHIETAASADLMYRTLQRRGGCQKQRRGTIPSDSTETMKKKSSPVKWERQKESERMAITCRWCTREKPIASHGHHNRNV